MLSKLTIKNFRCFDQININFNSSLILIEGNNGSGKTSILEALHFLGYLKSFRTHIAKELINILSDNFFIKAVFTDNENNENNLQVGFSGKKRLVKINEKSIQSYKELMHFYRVITLTEDDLALIKEGPDLRRSFIDQHILLCDSTYLIILKKYRQILENRNALLNNGYCSDEEYALWTKQLLEQSLIIQDIRQKYLLDLNKAINSLFSTYFNDTFKIKFIYEIRESKSYDFLMKNHLKDNELRQRRSLFGAHLDDFSIIFSDKKSRIFASRGQQKLIVLLIKIAQIKQILEKELNGSLIFILDDFMTDFDIDKINKIMPMLFDLNIQLIFTTPLEENPLKSLILGKNAQILNLNEFDRLGKNINI